MLWITIPESEGFNEETEEFVYHTKDETLKLEHSLVSISKWESHFHKPFMSRKQMTREEELFYVKCMTLTQNVEETAYSFITDAQLQEIRNYINDPMTATTFPANVTASSGSSGKNRPVTSELVYYWMSEFNIPSEFQKWHLNRLLTLIKVCEVEKNPPKKRSKKELIAEQERINELNRKRFNTKG